MDIVQYFQSVKDVTPIEIEIRKTHTVNNHQLSCPFHDDNQPSMYVFDDHFHCFGCGLHGSVIDWYANLNKTTPFQAACELGVTNGLDPPSMSDEWKSELQSHQGLTDYVNGCHQKLVANKNGKAYEYAKNQGLTDNIIKQWNIGVGINPPKNGKDWGLLAGMVERLIYPVYRGGLVVNLVARYPDDPAPNGVSKTLNLKGKKVVPFNEYRLYGDWVVVVEGPKDCVLCESIGLKSAAIMGITSRKWITGKKTTTYMCLDSGAEDLSIIHCKRLYIGDRKIYIIEMPTGKDPADMVNSGMMTVAHETAKPFIQKYIHSFDWETTDIYKRSDYLESILEVIAKSPQTTDIALQYLKECSNENFGALKRMLDAVRKNGNGEIEWEPENPKFFRPAQYWDGEELTYCAFLKTSSQLKPFGVSSKKELFPMTPEVLDDRGFIFPGSLPGGRETPRWSTGTNYSYGVHAFITKNIIINKDKLIGDIIKMFSDHIIYPSHHYKLFLSLWICNTYLHMIWERVTYIHLHGMKESGKSTTMALIAELAFNGWMSNNITESALVRNLHNNQSTAVIDEAEHYQTSNDKTLPILTALQAGYQKWASSAKSIKTGDDWESANFYPYGPKVFASIRPINDHLGDRCITLNMERVRDEKLKVVKKFSPQQLEKSVVSIRDRLYCWAMQNAKQISEIQIEHPLAGRVDELWEPILFLAYHFNSDYVDTMIEFALERKETKDLREEERNRERAILTAIIAMMKILRRWESYTKSKQNWYSTSEIISFASEQAEFKISNRYINMVIFDHLHIANRKEDKKKIVIDQQQVWAIRLLRSTVMERAQSVFGEDINWDEVPEEWSSLDFAGSL